MIEKRRRYASEQAGVENESVSAGVLVDHSAEQLADFAGDPGGVFQGNEKRRRYASPQEGMKNESVREGVLADHSTEQLADFAGDPGEVFQGTDS